MTADQVQVRPESEPQKSSETQDASTLEVSEVQQEIPELDFVLYERILSVKKPMIQFPKKFTGSKQWSEA